MLKRAKTHAIIGKVTSIMNLLPTLSIIHAKMLVPKKFKKLIGSAAIIVLYLSESKPAFYST